MTEPTGDQEWEYHVTAFQIDPSNPNNDQMVMFVREDLNSLLLSVEGVLAQAEEQDTPLASVLAVVGLGIAGMREEVMPRDRVCSILALALVHMCAFNRAAEEREVDATIARWLREVAREEVPDASV